MGSQLRAFRGWSWVQQVTPDGHTFYFNTITRHSTWRDVFAATAAQATAAQTYGPTLAQDLRFSATWRLVAAHTPCTAQRSCGCLLLAPFGSHELCERSYFAHSQLPIEHKDPNPIRMVRGSIAHARGELRPRTGEYRAWPDRCRAPSNAQARACCWDLS